MLSQKFVAPMKEIVKISRDRSEQLSGLPDDKTKSAANSSPSAFTQETHGRRLLLSQNQIVTDKYIKMGKAGEVEKAFLPFDTIWKHAKMLEYTTQSILRRLTCS